MRAEVHCGDCLEVMPGYPADAFDLIVADPPYFKVKNLPWDRQWATPPEFLRWLDSVLAEFRRLLKPNGSLYLFASPRMAARVEVLVGERFNMLNSIRWVKEAGWHNKTRKDDLRAFLNPWEAIIFAEHHNADSAAKGESGYGAKCDELRGFVFEPLRAYLDGERRRAGIDFEQVRQAVGCRPKSGLPGHWFTQSQWMLPTADNYGKLQLLFNAGRNGAGPEYLRRDYEDLRRDYEDLRRDYEDLRQEYESLRRPFAVTADAPYTDVWDFPTVQARPGKHPCEKPLAMIEHIVRASSREGASVLDPFCGSGVTGEACRNLGRGFVGIEADPAWAERALRRVTAEPLPLFAESGT